MNIKRLFENIEKQNQLREELDQPTLAVAVYSIGYKKRFDNYNDFIKDLKEFYIEKAVKDVLECEFEVNGMEDYIQVGILEVFIEERVV